MNISHFGKGTTIIEGSPEKLDELRVKLHGLGIGIQDSLYLELKVNPPALKELKDKYKIKTTPKAVDITIPPESMEAVNLLFKDSKQIKLYPKKVSVLFTLDIADNVVTASLPLGSSMLDSEKIYYALELLNLYNP